MYYISPLKGKIHALTHLISQMYYISPLDKQLGHVALILYSFEKSDPEKGSSWEKLVRHHWTNFIKWQRDDIVPKDEFFNTIKTVLAAKDFSSLSIV